LKNSQQLLEQQKLIVNIRRSRGKDIDAACGQLANKQEKV
jgi:23S rRNA (adenine2503-C2)-methyltransferase